MALVADKQNRDRDYARSARAINPTNRRGHTRKEKHAHTDAVPHGKPATGALPHGKKKCNSTARCCCRKPPPHHHTARCRFRSMAHAKQNLTQDTPKTSSSDHLGNTSPRGKGRIMAAIRRKEPAHLGPEQRALLISRTDNLDKASAKSRLS